MCTLRLGFHRHNLIMWLCDPPLPSPSSIFPNTHFGGVILLHWSAAVRAHPALVRKGHHHAHLHQCLTVDRSCSSKSVSGGWLRQTMGPVSRRWAKPRGSFLWPHSSLGGGCLYLWLRGAGRPQRLSKDCGWAMACWRA